MRILQAMVPEGDREEVVRVLEEQDRAFHLAPIETEKGESAYWLTALVPREQVESQLETLRAAGLERDGYVAVMEPEAVLSERFEREGDQKERGGGEEVDEDRIAREEIVADVRELLQGMPSFLTFSVLSAVVAAAGLLLNSPAVVVGSMVIAPLLGPAMASSVATVTRDRELFKDGIYYQLTGVSAAILGATLFALLARYTVAPHLDLLLIPQVAQRAYPGLLALTVALASGVAGALALTTGISSALVGVMIAVALIPPTAAIGLGIAYEDLVLLVGSTVLVLVNVVSINLAGLATLWIRGYRPARWWEEKAARWDTLRWGGLLVTVILLVSFFLGLTTYTEIQQAQFEQRVRSLLQDRDVDLLDLDVTYRTGVFFRSPRTVRVRVSGARPGFAAELRRSIREATGRGVRVEVVYERLETTRGATTNGDASRPGGGIHACRTNTARAA